MGIGTEERIQVTSPKRLKVSSLSAERIPLGIPGDYKPCIANLPSGELVLIAYNRECGSPSRADLPAGTFYEYFVMFRSSDGGVTWSDRQVRLDLPGKEGYLTVLNDGTMFLTSIIGDTDARNREGYFHNFLSRSCDGGRTWSSQPILWHDIPGAQERTMTFSSRQVHQLTDGTLVLVVAAAGGCVCYLWRSHDGGETWNKSRRCQFELGNVDKDTIWWALGGESILWQAAIGDLLGIFRVNTKVFPPLPGAERPDQERYARKMGGWEDNLDRMMVFRSSDLGRTWRPDKDLGYYGEMFPSILRLHDGRLLLTFTVRGLRPPLGVHAVLGQEREDGFDFDFENDRLVLDAKTPIDKPSGGGFGPTVQLDDGTLVTCYSYRGDDDYDHHDFRSFHTEVLRWKLPPTE